MRSEQVHLLRSRVIKSKEAVHTFWNESLSRVPCRIAPGAMSDSAEIERRHSGINASHSTALYGTAPKYRTII